MVENATLPYLDAMYFWIVLELIKESDRGRKYHEVVLARTCIA
jgi:hypothetical protein